ncbi:serine dehydratase beta chain [Streptomyces sp. NPDC100445]|uniref:serine dehydratase beta chain n=1 Tax=Streptomyces sp. NPDC100445 TaxID=3366102 RepID=UPI0038118537
MISAFDLFTVGRGPSSSHTVASMRAARRFATALSGAALLNRVESVRIELYGSLSATRPGHGTDKAVFLGLMGEEPATVDVQTADERVRRLAQDRRVPLLGVRSADYDFVLYTHAVPQHPNALTFTVCDNEGLVLHTRTHSSVGAGSCTASNPLVRSL